MLPACSPKADLIIAESAGYVVSVNDCGEVTQPQQTNDCWTNGLRLACCNGEKKTNVSYYLNQATFQVYVHSTTWGYAAPAGECKYNSAPWLLLLLLLLLLLPLLRSSTQVE